MPCAGLLSELRVGVAELRVLAGRGRFAEEENVELHLPGVGRVLAVKCFAGRRPYWGRWVEVFAVRPTLPVGGAELPFAGSELERALLERLSSWLGGGDLIYVEYGYDGETAALLRAGAPPAVTRLGFLLLQLGFTRLRDWYWPEGFMEGGQKLQGERPASSEAAERHLRSLREEVAASLADLERLRGDGRLGPFAERALERARAILGAPR